MITALNLVPIPAETTPAAQYAAWAAELGVSDTASLMGLDGDDSSFAFTLATGCLSPQATNAEFSTEGLIGWSQPLKANIAPPLWFFRMYYQGATPPDHFLAFRYEGFDCVALGVKLQKAAGVTIITGKIRKLGDTGERIEFAVRFPANSVDLPVFLLKTEGPAEATVYCWRLVEGSTAYVGQRLSALSAVRLQVESTELTGRVLPAGAVRRTLLQRNADAERHIPRVLARSAISRNNHYCGNHRIKGAVKQESIPENRPLARRVLLIDERANIVVREAWSDAATGVYAFDYINPEVRYMVVAFDYAGHYRAVVADNLTAEPMP